MTTLKIGRRRALLVLGAAAVGPSLVGCGEEQQGEPGLRCDDTTGLSQAVIAARRQQSYVDESPRPEERCDNCRYFQSGGEGRCGTCRVLEGPIHPAGWCELWATVG